MEKTYLRVTVDYGIDGSMRPVSISWPDGRVFVVDRILDVCQAPALRAGGLGMRYHCRICGHERYLFYDENGRWFSEPATGRALKEKEAW